MSNVTSSEMHFFPQSSSSFDVKNWTLVVKLTAVHSVIQAQGIQSIRSDLSSIALEIIHGCQEPTPFGVMDSR